MTLKGWLLLVLCVCLTFGCATSGKTGGATAPAEKAAASAQTAAASAQTAAASAQTAAAPPPVSAEPAPLLLQAGDVIAVGYVYWPELDNEQGIRPDGKVSLPLVGVVQAEGQTPEQLQAHLLELYKDKINDPEINIIVKSLDSHRVYVGGEVKTPGVIMIKGRLTVAGAIMESGGFNKSTAKLANVIVIRLKDRKQVTYSVDVRNALKAPESDPFYLEPFDVVYVPRTMIDRVDQFVDQYINQIVPRNVHYSFSQYVQQQKTKNDTYNVQLGLP